ncbi:ankyrin repeat domain-containing protein [Rubrivivax sp. RP6-9]|uniref:ankyrin repeat domain-containing protein n=1 Tax=Rubrivivax sp. RP6-9 TaxID=3415750 RepID=UPI003CC5C809
MARALPPHPHADHLRLQARDLLRALRGGDPEAGARAAPCRLPAPPRLAGAQLVIAREHGFASWRQLMDHVEQRRAAALSDTAYADRFLTLALGRGLDTPRPQVALALAQQRVPRGLAAALALGRRAAVQQALADADPNAALPPFDAPPLVYAAFSSLARSDSHRPGLVDTVAWLLARGADANAVLIDPAAPNDPLPVLYGATARAQCLQTVQLLLQAGAEPDDGESLYHATELADRRILVALVQAGARWTGTHALLRQLDHDDIEGLRQALALGADPNESGPDGLCALHHAVVRGRDLASVQLLVQHGADPARADKRGRTPAWHAARAGDVDILRWLHSLTGEPPVPAHEAFLAACAAADGASARAHLALQPDTVQTLPAADLRLLPDQAQRGRHAPVQLMLALGWPVDTPGDWDGSALNQAAFRGDAALVRLLLQHGARWHEPNGFGGDALGACLHAACHRPEATGDYAAVLQLLLDDGAPVPADEDLPDALRTVLEEWRQT